MSFEHIEVSLHDVNALLKGFLEVVSGSRFVLKDKITARFETSSATFCAMSLLGLENVKLSDLEPGEQSLGDIIVQRTRVVQDTGDATPTTQPAPNIVTTLPPAQVTDTLAQSDAIPKYSLSCLVRIPHPWLLTQEACEESLKIIAASSSIDYNIDTLTTDSLKPRFISLSDKGVSVYEEGTRTVCQDTLLYVSVEEMYRSYERFYRSILALCNLFEFASGICPFLDCNGQLSDMNREQLDEFVSCMQSSLNKARPRPKRNILKNMIISALGFDGDEERAKMEQLGKQLKQDFDDLDKNDAFLMSQIKNLGERMYEGLKAEDRILQKSYARISTVQNHLEVAEKLKFFRARASETVRSVRDSLAMATDKLDRFLSLALTSLDNEKVKCIGTDCLDLDSMILSTRQNTVSLTSRKVSVSTQLVKKLSCRLMVNTNNESLVHGLQNEVLLPRGNKLFLRGMLKEVTSDCITRGTDCPIKARPATAADLIFENLYISLRSNKVEIQCLNRTIVHSPQGYANCTSAPLTITVPFLYSGHKIDYDTVHMYLGTPQVFQHLTEDDWYKTIDTETFVSPQIDQDATINNTTLTQAMLNHPFFDWVPPEYALPIGATIFGIVMLGCCCCCAGRILLCIKGCGAWSSVCFACCDNICHRGIKIKEDKQRKAQVRGTGSKVAYNKMSNTAADEPSVKLLQGLQTRSSGPDSIDAAVQRSNMLKDTRDWLAAQTTINANDTNQNRQTHIVNVDSSNNSSDLSQNTQTAASAALQDGRPAPAGIGGGKGHDVYQIASAPRAEEGAMFRVSGKKKASNRNSSWDTLRSRTEGVFGNSGNN